MRLAHVRVLEVLYDRRELLVPRDDLLRAAQLSPRGLEGALEHLRRAGQVLEESPHGVRLGRPARLDAHLIERGLGTRRVGRNVICFAEVGSTNDVAFQASRQRNADGLAVLAEHQRKGRGRLGRSWISPPGANVLMSVLLTEPAGASPAAKGPAKPGGAGGELPHEAVTIAAGLAVAEGVEAACGVACQLKWPNDVCAEGRKLAGVLVEVRRRGTLRCVIVGVGINANASPPRAAVDRPATDLAALTGSPVERIEVVRHVLRRLDHWVGEIASGRLEGLHDLWTGRCAMVNHRAAVLCGGRRYEGRVLDVSPREGLVLRCDQGQTVRLPAETSSLLG